MSWRTIVPDPLPDLPANRRGAGARLLARIRRRYTPLSERFVIEGLPVTFTRIANPDLVLDQVADEDDRRQRKGGMRVVGDELHLPYWAELWDSAFALAAKLIREHNAPVPTDSSGPQAGRLMLNILDLGCGMGLSGVVAARLGHRVMFADLEPPSLLFAALNSLSDAPRIRTRRTNWRTDNLAERFDIILGADILYERAQWPFLDTFFRAHLAATGHLLLGEPGRQTGDLFLEFARERGYVIQIQLEQTPTRPTPVRILRVVLPSLAQ